MPDLPGQVGVSKSLESHELVSMLDTPELCLIPTAYKSLGRSAGLQSYWDPPILASLVLCSFLVVVSVPPDRYSLCGDFIPLVQDNWDSSTNSNVPT